MAKTLSLLIGAFAIALAGIAAPQPASAGSHVGVEVGPGGVYIGQRHRHYYDEDDYWRHRGYPHGAYYERDYHRYHHED
jgi:hypothetical protein